MLKKFVKSFKNSIIPLIFPELFNFLQNRKMKVNKANDALFSANTKKSINKSNELYNLKFKQYHENKNK